jgi:hypothetical protein
LELLLEVKRVVEKVLLMEKTNKVDLLVVKRVGK